VRIAYFDCFSGISGDMALAALVHAGAALSDVAAILGRLPLEAVTLQEEDVTTNEITARRIHVDAPAQPVIRTYANIRLVLDQSDLPVGARRTSQRIYGLLATAVGRVQGKDPDLVTFQEFGEADCLVGSLASPSRWRCWGWNAPSPRRCRRASGWSGRITA